MSGPDAASLLRDFVNTFNVQDDADELATPADLARWLAARDLSAARDPATARDLAAARALREGLRAAMLAHRAGAPPAPSRELDEVLAGLPVRVSLGRGGTPALVPLAAGTPGGLGRLAAAIVGSMADGTWQRLKVCQEDTCRWAFVDTSKNRSRSWCSMRVCGNRTKTRAYRARRAAAD